MDFKPYTEVVLPAKKAKFEKKRKGRAEAAESPPSGPREFKRPGDFLLLTDEPSPPGPAPVKTHVIEGLPRPDDRPWLDDTRVDRTEPEPEPEPDGAGAPVQAAAAPAGAAEPAAARVSTPRRESADRGQPAAAPKDFIIAYDGIFIGHYRSAKRITNRTAFRNVAARLRDEIVDFRLEKLEIHRPVRLEVDPKSIEGLGDESFEWFAAGE